MAASSWRHEQVCDLSVSDAATTEVRTQRELALVRAHLPALWRFLRRLGLSPEDADDAAQEIFVIAVAKLDQIEEGRERNFLYGIAVRLVSRFRRSQTIRAAATVRGTDIEEYGSSDPQTDELLDRKEARSHLDRIMESMTPDLRTTFALYELEEMTMAEIAVVTEAPMGTVASRLRRAREHFQEAVKRIQLQRSK
jgi:RNA polymerase sigma-70 factor (ECF subfamily)